MSKKSNKIILSIGVLAVLFVVYFILLQNNAKTLEAEDAAALEDTGIEVASFLMEDISSFSFVNEGISCSFIKEDEIWYYEEDLEFPLDQSLVTTLLSNITTIKADRKIENPEEDLTVYGLGNPSNIITISTKDNNVKTFNIGNSNAVTGGFYLGLEETAELYIIGDTIPTAFSIGLYDLAEMEDFPAVGIDSINHISILNGENLIDFTKLQDTDEDGNTVDSWQLKDQYDNTYTADLENTTTLLGTFASLGYIEMVEYNCSQENLSLYGLDDESLTVTIDYRVTEADSSDEITEENTVEESITLYIGNSGQDGNYYVKPKDSNTIFTIYGTEAEAISDIRIEDYIDS